MLPTIEYLHEAARHWLGLGFHLLPLQRGTKYMQRGWGVNLQRIKSQKDFYVLKPNTNIAIICNGNYFVLDFDSWDLYTSWARTVDECYTTSYTEYTLRGAHVWLNGAFLHGMRLVAGVEIKRVAVVAPSVVGGFQYEKGFGDIYSGDVDNAFLGLTLPGTPTAHLLRTRLLNEESIKTQQPQQPEPKTDTKITLDKIQAVKRLYNVKDVFNQYSPTSKTLRESGGDRWLVACCPFHDDNKPSMWIDTERGLWGCHGCASHGDVINLYAGLRRLSVGDAVRAMWGEVSR